MEQIKDIIKFPYVEPPTPGSVIEVSDGVYWAQLKLPMLIDHVNIYILEGANDLTIVDTGLNADECKSAWQDILRNNFSTKPVKNIIITHHHPDHIGLLGWFCENYNVEVFASRTSWLLGRMLYFDKQNEPTKEAKDFWIKAGMDINIFHEKSKSRPFNFSDVVSEFPVGFKALNQGDEIWLSGKKWRVEIGNGHAPDHTTLWGLDTPLILAGDQILPGISSNLGVYPTEPELDTVGDWLDTCHRFLQLAQNDHFVLPGHNLPFYGVSVRLQQLIDNHISALNRIRKKLSRGRYTAVDLFKPIFKREIRENEYALALAEAVGHLNYFRARNMVETSIREDGAILFRLK